MFKVHVKRAIIFAILGLAVAMVVGLISPKIYEGRTELVIGGDANMQRGRALSNLSPDIQEILDRGMGKETLTELQVLRGQAVFFQALSATEEKFPGTIKTAEDAENYYRMYDVIAEKDSGLAQVRAKAYNAEVAAELANQVTYAYNDIRQRKARESVSVALAYLNSSIDSSRKELRRAENELRDYKRRSKIADLISKTGQVHQYENLIRQSRDATKAELEGVIAELASQRRQLAATKPDMVDSETVVRNPVLQQYESQLADLRRVRAQEGAKYYEDSIQVRLIDEQIAEIQRRIRDEQKKGMQKSGEVTRKDPIYQQLQSAVAGNEARALGLRQRLDQYEAELAQNTSEINALPLVQYDLEQKQREYEILSQKYMGKKVQAEELKDRTEGGFVQAQQLSTAAPMKDPVAPDLGKLGLIGIIAGIAIGLLVSFGLESLRLRVYTSSQLSELTGLPVVATVPALPKARAARLLPNLSRQETRVMEGFRYMAFSALARNEGQKRTVMFTGIGGEVGTSSSAAQFAIAAARTGVRVLLVDFDVRRRSLSKAFKVDGKTGVSDVLNATLLPSGEKQIDQETQHPNLRILPAGTGSSDAVADASTAHIASILESLQTDADLIVIDTAPCDVVSDASRLAKHVDEVCLVLSATGTSYRTVPMAYDILKQAGASLISLILTHANPKEEAFSERALVSASRA